MLANALEEYLEYIYHVSALQLFCFLSGCRFHVPVNQKRAASGGFVAKVRQFSFLVLCLYSSCMLNFVIKILRVECSFFFIKG
jgi:hypothetical protein